MIKDVFMLEADALRRDGASFKKISQALSIGYERARRLGHASDIIRDHKRWMENEVAESNKIACFVADYVAQGLSEKAARVLALNGHHHRVVLIRKLLSMCNLDLSAKDLAIGHEILTWLAEQIEPHTYEK